jgi:hypothetical protein
MLEHTTVYQINIETIRLGCCYVVQRRAGRVERMYNSENTSSFVEAILHLCVTLMGRSYARRPPCKALKDMRQSQLRLASPQIEHRPAVYITRLRIFQRLNRK